jgi:3-isopropylmalate dehydrogenase
MAGKGVANPIAMTLTSCMMLEWLADTKKDERCADAARAVRASVDDVLRAGVKTPDLGGRNSSREVGDALVGRILANR